ncbi:MAG: hypothetical protein R3B70_43415 [Polyangiaceae bacterium]
MPSRQEMLDLVTAHTRLDDPMETAIWIRRDAREAWLVEVIPSMEIDPHPERPVAFNPGRSFRHPLNLIAGNMEGLRRALREHEVLARDVAAGEILFGEERGRELQELARSTNGHDKAS